MRTETIRDDLSDLEDPNHPHPRIAMMRQMQIPAEKAALPEELKEAMSLYRQDLANLPQGYIDWQRGLARAEIARLQREYGVRVLVEQEVPDDFFPDGMRLLRVAVETRSGKHLILQWHDGNQGFMDRCAGGGWGALFAKDLA